MNFTEIDTDPTQMKMVKDGINNPKKGYLVFMNKRSSGSSDIITLVFNMTNASLTTVSSFLTSNAKLATVALSYQYPDNKFLVFYHSNGQLFWGQVRVCQIRYFLSIYASQIYSLLCAIT